VSEELAAALVAIALALANELRRAIDAWLRQRGDRRTRRDDLPGSGGGQPRP
jgi:DNA-binding transcriptional ArsR family regulator